jgi:hypothetical protein
MNENQSSCGGSYSDCESSTGNTLVANATTIPSKQLGLCHTGKVLGDRLRVLGELQMYACTLEVCATVHNLHR